MGSPDGYGSHYGSPENASGIQKGRQQEIRERAARDHVGDELHEHQRAEHHGRPWWKRILRRT
jgi:hypothetical protein